MLLLNAVPDDLYLLAIQTKGTAPMVAPFQEAMRAPATAAAAGHSGISNGDTKVQSAHYGARFR